MQKWKSGVMSSSYADSYCLADYEKAKDVASAHFVVAETIEACAGQKAPHTMKVCSLKGEAPEGRLSYSTKAPVAKSCFRTSSLEAEYELIEAAVDEEECTVEMGKSAEEQGVIKAKLTTTTTTTTTTITEEQIVEDYFPAADVEVEDEVIDAKALFTSGEELLWEYKGKEFKCCWSSAGKPTELQDMTVGELPAARSYGSATGCGHMFGDTYHNGPKRHSTCPVLASVLKEIAGEDFEEIMTAASSFVQAGSVTRVGP
jgi:hypothetical protein